MQLSAEQQFALAQMSIPLWVRRNEEAPRSVSADPARVELTDIDVTKPWAVITGRSLTTAELRLLRAMLSSIDISFDDVAIVDKQPAEVLSLFAVNHTIGLILGRQVAEPLDLQADTASGCQRLHNGMRVLVGQDLQQLFAKPEQKAEMWQMLLQLQRLKAR